MAETDAPWWTRGNCLDVDPEVMFPSTSTEEVTRALRVCFGCPVSAECVEDGMRLGDFDGVRGGMEGAARRRLARSGQLPIPCARCKRPFAPSMDGQKRCKQCTHVSYKKSKNARPRFECPTCERSIELWRGRLRPHKWVSDEGWTQCPGTGAEPKREVA